MGKPGEERKKEDGLLNKAMNTLQSNSNGPALNTNAIFSNNQAVVKGILNCSNKSAVGILQFKPSINGNADNQSELPIQHSEPFNISTSSITCGNISLKTLIENTCADHSITIPGSVGEATCTSVVVAMAGKHAPSDADCTDTTSAEFVPVLSSQRQKHILAICYSASDTTVVKVDNLQVANSISCIGRKSKHNTAFEAIEIPNLVSLEMKDNNPALYEKLKSSACVVSLIEYEIEQYNASFYGAGFQTRGTNGISAHAVVAEGSQTQDNSRSIVVNGVSKVTKVDVFFVGAMVININMQEHNNQHYDNINNLMVERCMQLNNHYLMYKSYNVYNFASEINAYLRPHEIRLSNNPLIVIHTFLLLGSVSNIPQKYAMEESRRDPRYFFVDLSLPLPTINELVRNLQAKFGTEFCEYMSEANQNNDTLALRFSLSQVQKNMEIIKQMMGTILQDPLYLLAYQKIKAEIDTFEVAASQLIGICANYSLSAEYSDCVEEVFLRMFDCKEKLGAARFAPGSKDPLDKLLYCYFYLQISEDGAKQLVENINIKFPGKAAFISNKARIADKGNVDLMEIRIETSTLSSPEFTCLFSEKLIEMGENEPLAMEELRIKSRTLHKRSQDFVNSLQGLVPKYQSASERLSKSIDSFAKTIGDASKTQSERRKASQELKSSIYFFQSIQSPDELQAFKQTDKKTIKSCQKSLGLY